MRERSRDTSDPIFLAVGQLPHLAIPLERLIEDWPEFEGEPGRVTSRAVEHFGEGDLRARGYVWVVTYQDTVTGKIAVYMFNAHLEAWIAMRPGDRGEGRP